LVNPFTDGTRSSGFANAADDDLYMHRLTLCLLRNITQNAHDIKGAAQRPSEFLHCPAARIRVLCAPKEISNPSLSNGSFPKFKLDIVITNDMRLDDFGIPGQMLHTHSHTPGSISLVLDCNAALAGDPVSTKIEWMPAN
jgi:hypothetical protein